MDTAQMTTSIQEAVALAPKKPGVYVISDARGGTLYVGKARFLRDRLRQWFGPAPKHSPWAERMVQLAARVEYVVTDSEVEALILEQNFIKQHKPLFNIKLADDKTYPYLKVTVEQPFPTLKIVRELPKQAKYHDPKKKAVLAAGKGRFFGPYASAGSMRRTIRIIQELFQIATCNRVLDGTRRGSPCLLYHIGRCMAPCTGTVSAKEYREAVNQAIRFLEGKQDKVIADLERQMRQASDALEFERAARLRDKLNAVRRVIQEQKITSTEHRDQDVLGIALEANTACVQTFGIRNGRLVEQEHFMLRDVSGHAPGEVLESFIKRHYAQAAHVPKVVLVSRDVEDAFVLEQWLSDMRGTAVRLYRPQRGEKRRLVELADRNAEDALRAELNTQAERKLRASRVLSELQSVLNLPAPPHRIECFDISNTSGREAVGSMVVFENAEPLRFGYRRFKMRSTEGRPDDYAMLREMLSRRFEAARAKDPKFAALPDLVVVDGGKGQLGCALEVLSKMGFGHLPVAGLAKEFEQIYVPGQSQPIALPRHSPALQLLQHVRDEAHRFAITYHRGRRAKRKTRSALDGIPGIGPARRKSLLRKFGSLKRMRDASVDELAAVRGMTRPAAEAVWSAMHRDNGQATTV